MTGRSGCRLLGLALCFLTVLLAPNLPAASADEWLTHGGCIDNRRWARNEHIISPQTASRLSLKWAANTTGDVSATPAIYRGVVYAPDWGGSLFAINQTTGKVIWQKTMQDYGFTIGQLGLGPFARATPVIVGKTLVIGICGPAWVIKVSTRDGSLIWKTEVDPHPTARLTAAGTAYGGAYYTGVSSLEEVAAAFIPGYPCCTFIGSVVKLNLQTGRIVWQTYTLPPNGGSPNEYSGGPLWGSSPPIDVARSAIYFGTGNNYEVPDRITTCQQNWLANPVPPNPCLEPDNRFNSIISLNISSGRIIWSRRFSEYDAYTFSCDSRPKGANCPLNNGPDYDFGLNPAMACIIPSGSTRSVDVLIAGQKSGMVHAVNRDTGAVIWSRAAGPGGSSGGIAWGIAVDNQRVYVGIENNNRVNFTLLPGTGTTSGGAWVALDINSGSTIWSTANPLVKTYPISSWSMLTTVTNGVVFGGSLDPEGHVYALNAKTGAILKDFKAGASVYGGVSIDNGCAFFGTGYIYLTSGTGSTGGGTQKIIALCVSTP